MSKTYTESELKALGFTQQQIDSIARQSEEDGNGLVESSNTVDFSARVSAEMSRPLKATPVSKLKEQSVGELVELPGFVENEPFIARLRRPSLLAMVKKGKIPNTLLNEATELFSKGTSTVGSGKNTLEDMMQVVEIICEASLVEPSYQEIRDNDIELTDEQLMAIFSYSQRGVAGLKQFRYE